MKKPYKLYNIRLSFLIFLFIFTLSLSPNVSAVHYPSVSVNPTSIDGLWTPANVNFTISNGATSPANITAFNITAPAAIAFIGIASTNSGLTCSNNASLVNCTGANVGNGSSTWVQPTVNATSVGNKTFSVNTLDNATNTNSTTVNLTVYGLASSINVYPSSNTYLKGLVNSGCKVIDTNTSGSISSYFVNATLNNTQMWTNNTNASGDISGVLNTTTVQDGVYILYCRIYDDSTLFYKRFADGSSTNITVDNTPPSISFVSPTPANGAYIVGIQTINVTASDANGISTIKIFIDDQNVKNCTSSPCEYTWNTSTYSDGNHSFNATANDTLNNINQTETRTVTVDSIPPNANLTISPSNWTSQNTINYTPSCSDNIALASCITYVRNCGPNILIPCTGAWTQISTSQGQQQYNMSQAHMRYEFKTNATDNTGNINETSIQSVMYIINLTGAPYFSNIDWMLSTSHNITFCVSEDLQNYPAISVKQEDGNLTNATYNGMPQDLCYKYIASTPSNSPIKEMRIDGTDFNGEIGVLNYKYENESIANQLLTFPNTSITINFTNLPQGNFDLEVQQLETKPLSPPPNALPLYYSIVSNLTDGTFNATVCFNYTDAALAIAGITNENKLRLSYWNGTTWKVISQATIYPNENKVCAMLDHFTNFSLNSVVYVNGTDITKDWTSYIANNLYYDGILQLNFTSGLAFDDNVTRIDATWNGTANNSAITTSIYNDTDANGIFNKSLDTLISSWITFTGGVAYFNSTNINYGGLNYIPVPASGTRILFIVYNFTSGQASNTTMDAWIDTAGIKMSASGNTTEPINPDGYAKVDITNPSVISSASVASYTSQCGINFTNTSIVTYTPTCTDSYSGVATCITYVRYCTITNPATACTTNWSEISNNQTVNQTYNMTSNGRYEFKTNTTDNVYNSNESSLWIIVKDSLLSNISNIIPGNNSVVTTLSLNIGSSYIHPTGSYLRDGIIQIDGGAQNSTFDYTSNCIYTSTANWSGFTLTNGWHNVTMIVNDSVNTKRIDWRFKINSSLQNQSIQLNPKWNLISLALVPDNDNISSVLASIIDDVEIVWTYDSATATWLSYIPGGTSSLTTLKEGKGHWIKMKDPSISNNLAIAGTYGYPQGGGAPEIIPTFSVKAGWNLVSVHLTKPSTQICVVFNGLGACSSTANDALLKSTIGFNASSQQYYSVSSYHQNAENVTRGEGYWIYVSTSGTYPPAG
ncbi:MAG: Ig-like domain-containing protein [Candidatus Micrarchaeota archaeon]